MRVDPRSCPFCGNAFAPIAMRTGPKDWWVRCESDRGGCDAEGPATFHTRQQAIAAWNDRTYVPPPQQAGS